MNGIAEFPNANGGLGRHDCVVSDAKTRWYLATKAPPGVSWKPLPKAIRRALGSDVALWRGVAWVILATASKGHGAQREFAAKSGFSKDQANRWLQRPRGIRRSDMVALEAYLHALMPFWALDKCQAILGAGHHPLALSRGSTGQLVEPGDDLWEPSWRIARLEDPSLPTVEELRKRFPLLFPPQE